MYALSRMDLMIEQHGPENHHEPWMRFAEGKDVRREGAATGA
jgi:hypothetical protein